MENLAACAAHNFFAVETVSTFDRINELTSAFMNCAFDVSMNMSNYAELARLITAHRHDAFLCAIAELLV